MSHVLVIDDNEVFARAFCRMLVKEGWTAETMTSPLGARARLIRPDKHIDVVVLDCKMPALPGPAFLALLSEHEATANIPVVLISGAPDVSYAEAIRKHGHAVFVNKADVHQIIAGVRGFLPVDGRTPV
jgi:FixJ family two-component response regulator